ncbi:hypothetical protein B0I35DRAFT_84100 [Stachybotrys elegans]|uniref:FAD synthase n=1 Tax=Stachybotrys elegans TaxID=80388 RepID=A0A8K0SJU7_9HYPO|nr:hypothetical protein B0I35DRAFT_84100 [Stachybotrys elegans]
MAPTDLPPHDYPAKSPPSAHPPSDRPLHDVCHALKDKIDAFLAEQPDDPRLRHVQDKLRESMAIVEQALNQYEPDQFALSWNGGKDCLVMLVILLASIARCYPRHDPSKADEPNGTSTSSSLSSSTSFPEKLHAVYIVSAQPFAEVDEFVESSSAEYHLDTARFTSSMKDGLGEFLKRDQNIKAVFVGTRRTDPHGENLKPFHPTDPGWPPVMRLHPVLEWRLAEIWTFIRHLGIPYCPLYDQGYTSLGGRLDTLPNPRLKKEDGKVDGFRPAYELIEDDAERLGRYG